MQTKNNLFSLGGKYRDIVIAASLFIVFDLCVLILNFYTSFEIAKDATAINLAGRQRMLSQRMTKTLLQTETATTTDARDTALKELNATYSLFGTTFDAFFNGGETKNTDNTDIQLPKIIDEQAKQTLTEAQLIWLPLKENITDLLKNPDDITALSAALSHANNNNIELLRLMNQLTTRLAVLAQLKAERLRMFQAIGITFALVNFGFLLFHFLRKLNRSDAAAEEAREETEEILTTVNEGFFLIDENLNLGHQSSKATQQILRREIIPDTPFLDLLEGKVSQQTLQTTRDYIKLLFTKRIRESLATDLNPLEKLEIDVSEDSSTQDIHYLNISFKRVRDGDTITHLLGTIIDVTAQVRLEKSLAIAESRSQEELELLSQILQSNPLQMHEFLTSTKKLLLTINNMLEKSKTSEDYNEIINHSLPAIHKVKGDASVLGNEVFVSLTHDFENILKDTQAIHSLSSENMLPVTVHINTMLAKIGAIGTIIKRIVDLIPTLAQQNEPNRERKWLDEMNALAKNVSKGLGKQVEFKLTQTNLDEIAKDDAEQIRDICIQMIRNAIVHGIEPPKLRLDHGKPIIGSISVSLVANYDVAELCIKDDGGGIQIDKIKQSLLTSGRLSLAQLEEMDSKAILMSIFNSGVSTVHEASEHAGRGVGLTIVKRVLNNLGGSLKIRSRPGKYTEFHITFTNVRLIQKEGIIAA